MSNWAALFKKSLGKSDEDEQNEKTRMGVCAQIYNLVREIQEGIREFDPETRIGIQTQNSDNNKRISIIVAINGVAKDTVATFMLDEKGGWPVALGGTRLGNIKDLRAFMEKTVGDPESKLIKTILWAKMPPKEAESTRLSIPTSEALKALETAEPARRLTTKSEKKEEDDADHEETRTRRDAE